MIDYLICTKIHASVDCCDGGGGGGGFDCWWGRTTLHPNNGTSDSVNPLSRPFHQGVYIGATPAELLLDVDCFFVYVPKLFDTNSFLPCPLPASKIFPDIIVKKYVW